MTDQTQRSSAFVGPAGDLVRERYVPYRAEGDKRFPFETADYKILESPYDGSLIAHVGHMTEEQGLENLRALLRTHQQKRVPKTYERIEILKRAAGLLAGKQDQFADLIAWEGGKPLKDAVAEVTRAINSLSYAAEEAGRLAGDEIPMRGTKAASGRIAFTYPEAIGVVFAISAFNHPLNLIVHQVAPAIAVGCPVLVKPAAETPLSCLHFLDLLHEAGLPADMCLPFVGSGETAERLACSGHAAFVSFIGSARVGWHLKSVLPPGVRFSLEHGGTAPVVIDQSADIERATDLLLKGAFYHAGQVCVSVQKIFVHDSVQAEFERRFVELSRALVVGDPRHADTDVGPLIRRRDLERIDDWVQSSIGKGAECLLGAKVLTRSTYAPTILKNVSKQDRLMTEEVFGPVVTIECFRELNQAIERANEVPWAFQAAIFSRDLDAAFQAARNLRASAVMINESTTFRADWMPFRGDGPSGFGTGGIPYSMRDMVSEKMIVLRTPAFSL